MGGAALHHSHLHMLMEFNTQFSTGLDWDIIKLICVWWAAISMRGSCKIKWEQTSLVWVVRGGGWLLISPDTSSLEKLVRQASLTCWSSAGSQRQDNGKYRHNHQLITLRKWSFLVVVYSSPVWSWWDFSFDWVMSAPYWYISNIPRYNCHKLAEPFRYFTSNRSTTIIIKW